MRKITGSIFGYQSFGLFANERFRFRNRHVNRIEARHHAFNIAINRCFRLSKRNRSNRARCISANTGKFFQTLNRFGKLAAMLLNNTLRAGMKIPCA